MSTWGGRRSTYTRGVALEQELGNPGQGSDRSSSAVFRWDHNEIPGLGYTLRAQARIERLL